MHRCIGHLPRCALRTCLTFRPDERPALLSAKRQRRLPSCFRCCSCREIMSLLDALVLLSKIFMLHVAHSPLVSRSAVHDFLLVTRTRLQHCRPMASRQLRRRSSSDGNGVLRACAAHVSSSLCDHLKSSAFLAPAAAVCGLCGCGSTLREAGRHAACTWCPGNLWPGERASGLHTQTSPLPLRFSGM